MPKTRKKVSERAEGISEHDGHPIAQEQGTVLHVFGLSKDIGVVSVTMYNEKKALDIRRYYLDDEESKWKPTSKGMRIPADVAEGVLDALAEQRETISALIA